VTRFAALARHPLAIVGALIAAASAVVFIVLAIAAAAGMFHNPYAGLVIFIGIPALFVTGLLFMPVGMWLQRRKRVRDPHADEWPVLDFRHPSVRRTALMIASITAGNIVLVLLAGYGGLHWMESPAFCGQVCHTPMQPQFMAWQDASHGSTACVSCHIGEGAAGFVRAKLSGVRQLSHVITTSYARPTPPGAEMPPGGQAQTCRGCHRPERTVGDRIRVIRSYADDEANSESATVLQMHLGAGSGSGRAIHWHADPAVRVEYISTDESKETIPYVKVTDAKGVVREFATPEATDQIVRTGTRRTMDCIDCHNTVGHPIASSAEQAVDAVIAAGQVSRQLPHARREGVRLMKSTYSGGDEADQAIDREFRKFYESQGANVDKQAVGQAVAALQAVHRRSVFPEMKVTWGSYPDNRGHVTATGCFRCHDGSHVDKSGAAINADCEYCHKQVDVPLSAGAAKSAP
jgi:nitrate/TMAO reductase-like tetraheme cytochrome c subunit